MLNTTHLTGFNSYNTGKRPVLYANANTTQSLQYFTFKDKVDNTYVVGSTYLTVGGYGLVVFKYAPDNTTKLLNRQIEPTSPYQSNTYLRNIVLHTDHTRMTLYGVFSDSLPQQYQYLVTINTSTGATVSSAYINDGPLRGCVRPTVDGYLIVSGADINANTVPYIGIVNANALTTHVWTVKRTTNTVDGVVYASYNRVDGYVYSLMLDNTADQAWTLTKHSYTDGSVVSQVGHTDIMGTTAFTSVLINAPFYDVHGDIYCIFYIQHSARTQQFTCVVKFSKVDLSVLWAIKLDCNTASDDVFTSDHSEQYINHVVGDQVFVSFSHGNSSNVKVLATYVLDRTTGGQLSRYSVRNTYNTGRHIISPDITEGSIQLCYSHYGTSAGCRSISSSYMLPSTRTANSYSAYINELDDSFASGSQTVGSKTVAFSSSSTVTGAISTDNTTTTETEPTIAIL